MLGSLGPFCYGTPAQFGGNFRNSLYLVGRSSSITTRGFNELLLSAIRPVAVALAPFLLAAVCVRRTVCVCGLLGCTLVLRTLVRLVMLIRLDCCVVLTLDNVRCNSCDFLWVRCIIRTLALLGVFLRGRIDKVL